MSKKWLLSTVFLVFGLAVMAVAATPEQVGAYIGELKGKLSQAQAQGDSARALKIQGLISEQEIRLEEIRNKAQGETEESQLAEMREETNKALADLKSQIDKVKSDNNDVKVSGVVFFNWSKYTANGGTNVNKFDVTRAYLDFKKKLDAGASMRVTLDVARLPNSSPTSSSQQLFDYLKYAYVDLPINVGTMPFSLIGKIGLQHTAWIDWADKQLGLRFIAKSLIDNQSVMSSADFGLGAAGKLLFGGVPEINYHVTALNGTGYSKAETDSGKAVGARFDSRVYAADAVGNFDLGVWANAESVDKNLDLGTNKQYGLGITYSNTLARVFGETVMGKKSSKDINGISIGTVVNLEPLGLLPGWSVFARLDNYDPNTSDSSTNDLQTKSFYGLIYNWGKDVKLALDMQTSKTGSGVETSIFYFHSSISY